MVGTPGIEPDVEVVPHRGVALRHDAQRETGVRVSHAGPPCDVLYQVRIAPRARARIAPSSMRNVIGSVCPLMTGTNSAVLTLLRSRPVATTSTSAKFVPVINGQT